MQSIIISFLIIKIIFQKTKRNFTTDNNMYVLRNLAFLYNIDICHQDIFYAHFFFTKVIFILLQNPTMTVNKIEHFHVFKKIFSTLQRWQLFLKDNISFIVNFPVCFLIQYNKDNILCPSLKKTQVKSSFGYFSHFYPSIKRCLISFFMKLLMFTQTQFYVIVVLSNMTQAMTYRKDQNNT